ncbi:MAG: nuclear transport factor 2 family protein [Bacteroidetes bacterium]|nr:nuclear transport factor 2 family protein [Bacteroidota bacterium]
MLFSQDIRAKTLPPDSAHHADSISTRKLLTGIISKVIEASGSFDVGAVGDLYTPNALVADEQPPFSWNGPTAGAQWIGSIEKTCRDLKIKRLKGRMGHISVYLQSDESVYVIVPVTYTGDAHGDSFEESGAFTFVFRLVNDRWLIKSQVWMPRKGL